MIKKLILLLAFFFISCGYRVTSRKMMSFVLILIILFTLNGCVSYYIGYFGYHKNKIRRYSDTKEESISRKMYIKNLKFQIDIPIIKNVYIEYAYRWGRSYNITKKLTPVDTFSLKNQPDKPYQIVVEYKTDYNNDEIFLKEFWIYRNDSTLYDTLKIEATVTDIKTNHKTKYVLKIWE